MGPPPMGAMGPPPMKGAGAFQPNYAAMHMHKKGMKKAKKSLGCFFAAFILFDLIVGGIIYFAVYAADSSDFGMGDIVAAAGPTFQFSSIALVHDVNGDGDPDIIGEMRSHSGGTKSWIAAYDGKDGEVLWESEEVDARFFESDARWGITDKQVFLVDDFGKVKVLDIDDGTEQWATKADDRADELCAGKGFLGILTADEKLIAFRAKDGKPVEKKKEDCKLIQIEDNRFRQYGAQVVNWSKFDESGIPDMHSGFLSDYRAHKALVPEKTKTRFLIGQKASGRDVPMFIATDGTKELWKLELPEEEPLNSSLNDSVANYHDGIVCGTYAQKDDDDQQHVVCVDAESGKRKWDTKVVSTFPAASIVMTDDRVFFSTWTQLFAFDRDTGKLKFSLGE